jgi:N-acetylmuramoyl-L-alanine amidase
MPPVIDRASANFGARKPVDGKVGIRHVVLHYTGMTSCGAALDRLCDPQAEVSAHYLIDEDGAVYRLVAEENRAWHAGQSFWRGVRDLNSTSIGIEIVNPGHEFGYRAFPEAQITALLGLLGEITARHRIRPDNLVGHSDIAPARKADPGELFPWERLAAEGFGLWPEPAVSVIGVPDLSGAFRRLSEVGYAVPLRPELGSDILDPASGATDVIKAFQRRFRPSRVDGHLDRETATVLAAVDVRYARARAQALS